MSNVARCWWCKVFSVATLLALPACDKAVSGRGPVRRHNPWHGCTTVFWWTTASHSMATSTVEPNPRLFMASPFTSLTTCRPSTSLLPATAVRYCVLRCVPAITSECHLHTCLRRNEQVVTAAIDKGTQQTCMPLQLYGTRALAPRCEPRSHVQVGLGETPLPTSSKTPRHRHCHV